MAPGLAVTPQQSLEILHTLPSTPPTAPTSVSIPENQQDRSTTTKQGVAEKGRRYLDGVHMMLTWLSHFATPQSSAGGDASPVSIGEQLQSLVDKHAKRYAQITCYVIYY